MLLRVKEQWEDDIKVYYQWAYFSTQKIDLAVWVGLWIHCLQKAVPLRLLGICNRHNVKRDQRSSPGCHGWRRWTFVFLTRSRPTRHRGRSIIWILEDLENVHTNPRMTDPGVEQEFPFGMAEWSNIDLARLGVHCTYNILPCLRHTKAWSWFLAARWPRTEQD